MLELNFEPFPVLETDRLLLRTLTPEDANALFAIRGNTLAMKYIGKPVLTNRIEVERLIEGYREHLRLNKGIIWGISLKSNGRELLGTIGFHRIEPDNYRAEIGYILRPEQWNKGIMKEALVRVVDYGFLELKFHSIEGRINPENTASAQVLLKNGFVKEAYFKESFCFNGQFQDTEVYSRLTDVVI